MLKTPRKAFAIRFICFLSLTLLLCGCGILEDTTNPIGMIVSSFRSTAEPAGVDEITTALEEQAATGTVTAGEGESITATPDPTEAAEFAETAVSIAAEAVEIVEEAAAEEATPTPTIQELEIWIPPQFDPAQDTPAGRALQDAVTVPVAACSSSAVVISSTPAGSAVDLKLLTIIPIGLVVSSRMPQPHRSSVRLRKQMKRIANALRGVFNIMTPFSLSYYKR